jgi:hypothetical protein
MALPVIINVGYLKSILKTIHNYVDLFHNNAILQLIGEYANSSQSQQILFASWIFGLSSTNNTQRSIKLFSTKIRFVIVNM